jgi:addiction module HigA family antidote
MDEVIRKRRPSHPGAILRAHYLEVRGIGIGELAAAIEMSRKHLSQVVNGHKRVEPTLAARLAKALGTTAQFWLNLQAAVDAWDAMAAVECWKPGREFPPPTSAAA